MSNVNRWMRETTKIRTLWLGMLAAGLFAFLLPGCPGSDDDDDSTAGDDDDATADDDDDATAGDDDDATADDDDVADDDDATAGDDDDAADDDDATAGDDDDTTPPVSFASDVMPLFSGCNCHMTGNPSAAFSLDPSAAYANMVDVAATTYASMDRIEPGDPERSFVLLKVRDATPPAGQQMPTGGPYLSQAEVDVIADWITEGAMDN